MGDKRSCGGLSSTFGESGCGPDPCHVDLSPSVCLFGWPQRFDEAVGYRSSVLPYGLVVRIRRSHRRGPGSIPGVGKRLFIEFTLRHPLPGPTLFSCIFEKKERFELVTLFPFCVHVLFFFFLLHFNFFFFFFLCSASWYRWPFFYCCTCFGNRILSIRQEKTREKEKERKETEIRRKIG